MLQLDQTLNNYNYRYFFLATALIAGQLLSAQTADRLTDLNYGNLARSQADRIYAAGGKLYATYRYVNHVDGKGFIVEVDPASGTTKTLLAAERGTPFAGNNARHLARHLRGRWGHLRPAK